jgi:hypothetical protein
MVSGRGEPASATHHRGRGRIDVERRIRDLLEQRLQPIAFEEAAQCRAGYIRQGGKTGERSDIDAGQSIRHVETTVGSQSLPDGFAQGDRRSAAARTRVTQGGHQAFTTLAP